MLLWDLFGKFPGTDYESFNYDWIIGKLKELKDSVAAAKSSEDAAAESATEAHSSLVAAIAQVAHAGHYATNAAESASAAADSASAAADSATDAYNSAERYIRNNIFVTPEMYGAVGDGVTADDAAFIAALATGMPVMLESKIYKLDSALDIPESSSLYGSGTTKTTLICPGIILRGRENHTGGYTIQGPGTGTGLTLAGSSSHVDFHRNRIENIIINNFDDGIKNSVYFWNNIFENIRINNCARGINFPSTSFTSFGNVFEEVYTNECTQCLKASGLDAVFIACNFGIKSNDAVLLDGGSRVNFINSNFECDGQVSSGSIFNLSSDKYKFTGCVFRINGAAGTHTFSCSNVNGVIIEHCRYSVPAENQQASTDFWNKSGFTTTMYGAIVLGPSAQSVPRPDPYNTQMPNWTNADASNTVMCWGTGSLDGSKTYEGAILYDKQNKKQVMYNGTAFVDV